MTYSWRVFDNIKQKITNVKKLRNEDDTFDVFWVHLKKTFNTKYHEGTKDKKN
jgi:hypothetical protein